MIILPLIRPSASDRTPAATVYNAGREKAVYKSFDTHSPRIHDFLTPSVVTELKHTLQLLATIRTSKTRPLGPSGLM